MEARATVVSVRVDDTALKAIDLLVQAGLAQSRSEAAAQLVSIGVNNAGELLQQARRLADSVQRVKRDMIDAVKARDVERVKHLLEQDGALAPAPEGGDTPILLSVYYGAREVTDLLLARGVALNLYEAAAVGATDRLRELLGAEPGLLNAYSHDGWTALHLAAFFGRRPAAEYLLGLGADVSAISRNGMANTALHAALAGRHTEVAHLLLGNGAPVDVADSAGWHPLHHAAANGDAPMAAELLRRGAQVNALNNKGLTPLALALEQGHAAVADLLRQAGA